MRQGLTDTCHGFSTELSTGFVHNSITIRRNKNLLNNDSVCLNFVLEVMHAPFGNSVTLVVMSQIQRIALVAVPRPLPTTLSYSVPPQLSPVVGGRVTVPLGRQQLTGVVMALQDQPVAENTFALKAVTESLDETPLVDTSILALLEWAARYYHYPIGEVLFTALPVALRKAKPINKRHTKPPKPVVVDKAAVDAAATLQLTAEQQHCLQTLQEWIQHEHKQPILLHGITGSGKTEIYLRLLEPLVNAGQQVLVIVPEIGLTPQLLMRFKQYFADTPMVCLHSGLTDGARFKAWLQAREGQARIIIGTRSAIFTPAPQLSLIVIDEEHDASLKQQEGFRYHARDLAIKRAQMLKIPIVLGTATPSLESLHNAQAGRYHYSCLKHRPGMVRVPNLQIQDSRPFELQAGLTPDSLQAIRQTLQRGEQVMIFLNRRGFAPTLYCPACGWQATCEHCSVNLTWHARRNRLMCHHCGAEQNTPVSCPQCHSTQITTYGQGTERLEMMLQSHFSEFPVIRFDRDATQPKGALEEKLEVVRSNAPLMLVGTQMLAKGHDFPNLTLVIILDIDHSLLSTDYRALERLGQLLVQVAGRAGRAEKPGQVILQTTQPEHPLIHQLIGHGYTAFAKQLLGYRQRWGYPPFGYHALIRASASSSMEKSLQWLEQISQLIANINTQDIQRLGPVPAPIEKRANRYRAQLLVGSHKRAALHQVLYKLHQQEKQLPGRAGIRWSIDVDPIEFS